MSLSIELTAVVTETEIRFKLDPDLGPTIADQLIAEALVVVHSSDPTIPDQRRVVSRHVDVANIPTLSAAQVTGLYGALGAIATNAIDSISPDLRT